MMVYHHFQQQDNPDSAFFLKLRQTFVVNPSSFAPEARERMTYMSLLVISPLAVFIAGVNNPLFIIPTDEEFSHP